MRRVESERKKDETKGKGWGNECVLDSLPFSVTFFYMRGRNEMRCLQKKEEERIQGPRQKWWKLQF